jgi:hypothetical protein
LAAFFSPQAASASEKTKNERQILDNGSEGDPRGPGFRRAFCIMGLAFCPAAQADLLAFEGRSIVEIAGARSNALRPPRQIRATAR